MLGCPVRVQDGEVPEHRARIFCTRAAREGVTCTACALLFERETNGGDGAAAEESHNFSQLSDGAIDAIIEYAGTLPLPQCEIFVGTIGGQTAGVAPAAMAYSSRDANYVMNVHGRWESAAEDERCIAWAREFFAKSQPFASGGAYINFLTQDETDRVAFAYGATYKQLVELKKKYDPTRA